MIDDLTVYRLGPEHYWLIATPSRAEAMERHVTEQARDRRALRHEQRLRNRVPLRAGPRLTGAARSRSPPPTCPRTRSRTSGSCQTTVAEVPTLRSRTGYSGELGFELYFARDYALHLWDTLTAAGATPCGLGALRSTRMEKKNPLYGLDVSETTSPLEAGLGWAVDLDAEPFVGRDALCVSATRGRPASSTGIEFPISRMCPPPATPFRTRTAASWEADVDRSRLVPGKALAMGYLPRDPPAGTSVTVTVARRGRGRRRHHAPAVLRPGRDACRA